MKTLTISLVLVVGLLVPQFFAAATINTLNGLSNSTQFLTATGTDANLSIRITSSSPSTNFFKPIWSGVLSISRGGTGTSTMPGNGQLLIGNGTGYAFASLIQGSNAVITNAAGSITIAVTSTPAFTSISLTNPLAPVHGGTGISSFSTGDILIAQDPTTLVRLPKGLNGQVLMVSSTAQYGIAWVTLASSTPIKHFQVDTSGTLTTGLQAYYKFEDATDYYSTNTLTNNGSVAFNTGKISNAADFGSSNTTKYLTINSNLGIDGGISSIAGWVNITTAPASGVDYSMISQYSLSANSDVMYSIDYWNNSGVLTLVFSRNKVNLADESSSYTTTLTTGVWYHVVLTYDGSIRGYLNGSLVAGPTTASGNGNETAAYQTQIGAALGGFNLMSGLVDEVGYWSKALSTTEITDLYNGGAGQTMVQ